MDKKRILFNSEASYLNTGYAAYGREVIKRLIDTGKYEVAEYSCYGSADDSRRGAIPWKNYPVAPTREDSDEEKNRYNSNPANQFGAWRFERTCLDFKPDMVCSQRDPWMESWIKHSPFRSIFSWAWASTVDSEPQSPEWINQFADADYFYTLSEWAAGVIKQQAGPHINHVGTVTSCAANEFQPVPNKSAHRIAMGINPDWKIIGTVMRNQRRKLFPDLFKAFGQYIHENNATDTYLYCHTSYPDNGWDIPELMMKHGISSRVLFSYACETCNTISIGKFSDAVKQCKNCKKFAAKLSSVSSGATIEELAKIYNIFDVFAQYSNSEGIGIPAIEAGACGVPVMAVDFSAMSSVVRSVNGYPIPVKVKALELETGCYRAIPDQDATVLYWKTFFEASEDERASLSAMTRRAYETNYSWDKVIDLWMKSIDACPKANWSKPMRQINIPTQTPKFNNNKEFVDWALRSYMPYSNIVNSYEANCLLRDMNFQCYKPNPCGYFYAENSYSDRVHYQGFGQETLINAVKSKAEIFNFWEKARTGEVQFNKENWL